MKLFLPLFYLALQQSPTSKTRPYGPTPLRGSGKGSPSTTRPSNPTPAHANKGENKPQERATNNPQSIGIIHEQTYYEESECSD